MDRFSFDGFDSRLKRTEKKKTRIGCASFSSHLPLSLPAYHWAGNGGRNAPFAAAVLHFDSKPSSILSGKFIDKSDVDSVRNAAACHWYLFIDLFPQEEDEEEEATLKVVILSAAGIFFFFFLSFPSSASPSSSSLYIPLERGIKAGRVLIQSQIKRKRKKRTME